MVQRAIKNTLMANSEHLAKLKKNIEEWNAWREANPEIEPDLNGANLSKANLSRAHLSWAALRRANLSWAALRRANLSWADLGGANLFETIFGNTNLNDVQGLDTCVHHGPSTIDYRTIAKSEPLLPLVFLRGCGLPDEFIDYLPSLLNQPIQFYSCFISYSTQDQPFADRLYADLQNKNVRCWFASHNIQGGKKIHEQIDEAIRVYDRLLLILSDASMASEWIKDRNRQRTPKGNGSAHTCAFPN